MGKSTIDLCSIMKAGGSVSIDSSKSTTDLCSIARAGLNSKATLTIRNAERKSTIDMCLIAKAGNGRVTFEFN